MNSEPRLASRRAFLQSTALAAAGVGLASFTRPAARDDGLNSLGDVRCASRAQRAERRRPQTR